MSNIEHVEVTVCGQIFNKLQLIKIVRDYTEKGLKQCKDWVDNFEVVNGQKTQILEVRNPQEFELRIKSLNDNSITINSKSKSRNKTLVKLGIGTIDDKIDVLSSEMSGNLHMMPYDKLKIFFKDFLKNLEENEIDKLLNKN